MPRGSTLSTIRGMVKAEIGDYNGTNTNSDAGLNQLIANVQTWLTTEYSWPFLERRWDVPAPGNSQFLTLPTTDDEGNVVAVNLVREPKVEVFYNNQRYPVLYGIGADEYNFLDFTLGQQADPIRKWRIAGNVDEANRANQFEVWPVPLTPQTIRFTGERVPLVLAADADKADLDDQLLTYFTAAARLKRLKQNDAQDMMQKAGRVLQLLRQAYPTPDKRRILGGGVQSDMYQPPEGIKLVAIH